MSASWGGESYTEYFVIGAGVVSTFEINVVTETYNSREANIAPMCHRNELYIVLCVCQCVPHSLCAVSGL